MGHYKPAHEGHSKHEYEVFHVDFERVEIPFIIALWIFVSSLAKIGEYSFPIQSRFLQKEPRQSIGFFPSRKKNISIAAVKSKVKKFVMIIPHCHKPCRDIS